MARQRHRAKAAQRRDEWADTRGERGTPGADAFAVIREPDVLWDDDAPILRADERYDRLAP